MTRPSQEDEEILALHRFRSAYPWNLDNYVEKGETPDFLFLPSRIGLEVTELVRPSERSGSTDRGQESYQEQVSNLGARHFADACPGVFVEVHILWQAYPAQKVRRDTLAATLANYVAAIVPQARHDYVDVSYRDLAAQPLLRETIDHLSVIRLDPGPSFWNSGAGTAPDVYPDEMQFYVTKKEGKVSTIRQRADQAWLLIYAPATLASNHVNIQPASTAHRYLSSFARVFIMDWWTWNHCLELVVDVPDTIVG